MKKRSFLHYAYLDKKRLKKVFPHGKLKTIFLNHWEEYKRTHVVRTTENINVLKMLSCRTPLLGKHVYTCPSCSYELEVPHSCKSRFCSVCGYLATENWIKDRGSVLLDCYYHHVVVTVPAYFRWMLKQDRKLTLNLFAKSAASTIQEWVSPRGYEVGMVMFFHSFGSNLQFHPHFHILVTAGGLTPEGLWKYTDENIPGNILMPIFRAKFIYGMKSLFLKGKLKTKAPLTRIYYQMNHQADIHWQFYTKRITRDSKRTILYCARYCKKMILSEQRIIDYDGKEVSFFNSKKSKILVYPVMQFIKCVVQHIPESNFRHIRYYGFYSNTSKKKYDLARKYWKPLLEETGERLDWRARQILRNANDEKYPEGQPLDPLTCPTCKTKLVLTKVIYPEPYYKRRFDDIRLIFGLEIQQKIKLDYG